MSAGEHGGVEVGAAIRRQDLAHDLSWPGLISPAKHVRHEVGHAVDAAIAAVCVGSTGCTLMRTFSAGVAVDDVVAAAALDDVAAGAAEDDVAGAERGHAGAEQRPADRR